MVMGVIFQMASLAHSPQVVVRAVFGRMVEMGYGQDDGRPGDRVFSRVARIAAPDLFAGQIRPIWVVGMVTDAAFALAFAAPA